MGDPVAERFLPDSLSLVIGWSDFLLATIDRIHYRGEYVTRFFWWGDYCGLLFIAQTEKAISYHFHLFLLTSPTLLPTCLV